MCGAWRALPDHLEPGRGASGYAGARRVDTAIPGQRRLTNTAEPARSRQIESGRIRIDGAASISLPQHLRHPVTPQQMSIELDPAIELQLDRPSTLTINKHLHIFYRERRPTALVQDRCGGAEPSSVYRSSAASTQSSFCS